MPTISENMSADAMTESESRKEILEKVREFYIRFRKAPQKFERGKGKVPYAGRIYNETEMQNAVDACLDFWLTYGRYCEKFEAELSKLFDVKYCSLTNSGSSANLLAVSALTSKSLGDLRLKRGDKIITTAASFPTTVNPIFQNGFIPRFIDIEIETYNPSPKMVEAAIDEKTKAIILAHTLGNPFDAEKIAEIAKENGLFLIEDCCDAIGSTLNNKNVGTFGDIATVSFYPAHHITTGEGGAVLTSNPLLKKSIESFRDWGRDCWCPPGKDNSCARRFGWKLGELPYGYDHKYIYSNIGYNLKMLEMQAAIGLAQLGKLSEFIQKRKDNYSFFLSRFSKFPSKLVMPKTIQGAEISPFGFPITIARDAGFGRNEIVTYLESKGIATRMLFGGNLTKQPAYLGENFEVVGNLTNSDMIMTNTFWIGVYPGITEEMRKYIAEEIEAFLERH